MIEVSRIRLRILSIAIGLLFTAVVYQAMHDNPRWDWTARGIGKLPREVVGDFMQQAYAKGRGGSAALDYFTTGAEDNAQNAQDRRDGNPIPHDVRSVIGQGMTVIVFHRIGPARGEPQLDVIDRFEVKDGRIARRDRFVTRFDDGSGGMQ